MSIKLIAIGNRLMGDDAVAINIAEKLEKKLKDIGVEVIIGETDFQYCLSNIKERDYIIILDSTYFGIEPGSVTVNLLKEINKLNYNNHLYSQHSYNLIEIIDNCYKSIDGIVIGIEGFEFNYSLSMSKTLEQRIEEIRIKVKEIVCNYVKSQAVKL